MSEAWVGVVAAIITGIFAVISQVLIARNNSKELYAKLDKNSDMADQKLDAKLEKFQAVTETKIMALTEEVRKHNEFARRVPVLEEKVAQLEKKGA